MVTMVLRPAVVIAEYYCLSEEGDDWRRHDGQALPGASRYLGRATRACLILSFFLCDLLVEFCILF
jgi:hypothetical protein